MRRRYSREREADGVLVGERVWLLKGNVLRVADVEDVKVLLAGDPSEFRMYRVRTADRVVESVHRSELFRAPSEKRELLAELDSLVCGLQFYAEDIKDRPDDQVPEIGDDV